MKGCAHFGERELSPHLTQCGRGRGLPPCQVSSSSTQPFGHNTPTSQTDRTDRTHRHTDTHTNGHQKTMKYNSDENWGRRLCPYGAGSPSNTMWQRPRSTSMPSAILIHPAVWPQQIWVEHWGLLCPFLGGRAGSLCNNVAGAEAYPVPLRLAAVM